MKARDDTRMSTSFGSPLLPEQSFSVRISSHLFAIHYFSLLLLSRGMTPIAQLLSLAGIDTKWERELSAKAVRSHRDIMHVPVCWLTCLGLTFTEAHSLLTTAWSVWSAGSMDNYLKILAASTIKQAEVTASLQSAIDQLDEGPVRDCLCDALEHLGNPDARSGALALASAARAQTQCSHDDEAPRSLCGAARIAIRDAFVWRVQLACVWGDRDAFVDALEQAYGRPVDECSMSRILNSHNKMIGANFPSAFLSKCKCESEARGYAKRPPKKKRAAMETEDL